MMSSCCTLRLKRRRAFSNDSPSCNLTSAKLDTPPNLVPLDHSSYGKVPSPSQEDMLGFATVFGVKHPKSPAFAVKTSSEARIAPDVVHRHPSPSKNRQLLDIVPGSI